MQLHDIHVGVHKHKRPKRIGRGSGSGNGKTAGKGHKGHSSRQGYKQNPLMEGGQMPIIRRVPKRGFNNGGFRKDYATINVEALQHFNDGSVVDEAALRAVGIVKGRHDDGLKILGDGSLTRKLIVHAQKFSAGAIQKISEAGGQTVIID